MHSLISVNVDTATQCCIRAMKAGNVPMLWGGPGSAKSTIGRNIANDTNRHLIDLRLSTCEPTDLGGLPWPDADKGKFTALPFDQFILEGEKIPDDKKGVLLFLDEVPLADVSTKKAMYKLILDRMIGDKKLHKKTWIMMAGNDTSSNIHSEELGAAIESRISPHLEVQPNAQQWIGWALENGIDYRISSFIEARPDFLSKQNPDSADKTFACPRTWEMINPYMTLKEKEQELQRPLIAGTVGQSTAVEFFTFMELFDKFPKMDAIVANPDTIEYDSASDVLYALSGYISEYATEDNIDQLLTFIGRWDIAFQTLAVRNIRRRHVRLRNHTSINNWMLSNAQRAVA